MHKLLNIQKWEATRHLELMNIITNTKDICFDDSSLVSFNNFDFMTEGEIYDCKIALLGEFHLGKVGSGMDIIILEEVFIGKKNMFKIQSRDDIYYIPQVKVNKIDKTNVKNNLIFQYTRKNLIQVNDIIHKDYI